MRIHVGLFESLILVGIGVALIPILVQLAVGLVGLAVILFLAISAVVLAVRFLLWLGKGLSGYGWGLQDDRSFLDRWKAEGPM